MSKYTPLGNYLRRQGATEVPLSFSDIERIVGSALPPKAKGHRAWWSNNPTNNVMTKIWLDAGFQTERVDMAMERLVFRRAETRLATPARTKPSAFGEASNQSLAQRPIGLLERIRSRLAGTVTIPPGVDLMEPLWENEGGDV